MSDRRKAIIEGLKDTSRFRGATGEYPKGQSRPDDEGELQFAIHHKGGEVMLDFGTPVTWLGMDAQQAADLAGVLLRHARDAAKETGTAIIFSFGGKP